VTKLCFEELEIDAVLRAPEDSEAKRHARECPRCGALLASYAEFTSESTARPPELIAAAGLVDVREQLRRAREQALASVAPEPPGRAPLPTRTVTPREGGFSRFFAWLRSPIGMSAAAGFAAAALAIVVIQRPSDRLRGPGHEGGPRVEVEAARVVPEGVEFRWTPFANAKSYELRLLDRSLHTARAIEVDAGTRYILSRSDRESLRDAVYWQVSAEGDQGRLALSRLEELPAP